MFKLSRLSAFAALVVLILLVQVTAFAGNGQAQEPSAGNADSKTQTSKTTKKRKKKKVTTSAPLVVFAAPVISAETTAPVAVKSVTVTPTEVAPAARNTSSAARVNTGVYVSPSGTPVETAASAGQLVISEFRVRGPNGANDEFIEITNKSGADHTVSASSGTGYGVAASDGTTRCTIADITSA
jgi:hypothetical protein